MNRSAEFLLGEYQRRKTLDPALTNNQFAKLLGIPASRLSDYFNGRRIVTMPIATKIIHSLGLSDNEFQHLKTLIEFDKKKSKKFSSESQLREDEFALICDWYHFAILALLEVKNLKSTPEWIAQRINIPLEVAKVAIERLIRMGLMKFENGRYMAVAKQLEMTPSTPSHSLRRSHRQSLMQVVDGLDYVPLEMRDVTSITFSLNRKNIPTAKKMIKNFRRKLALAMAKGNKTDVYNLNVQLFPVTKV